MVAASAQPARPMFSVGTPPISMSTGRMMSGTTDATPPSSVWSISRSRSHDAQNASESMSVRGGGANACASPVQPSRSSRCGQSVGTETKLSRCDQKTFEWNWSRASCEERNELRGARSLEIAIARGRDDLGADDIGVAEAVEREDGLEHVLAVAVERVDVGRLGAAQRGGVQVARRLEHLGVADGDRVARAARAPSRRTQPAMF